MTRQDRLYLMAATLLAHRTFTPTEAVADAFELDRLVEARLAKEAPLDLNSPDAFIEEPAPHGYCFKCGRDLTRIEARDQSHKCKPLVP